MNRTEILNFLIDQNGYQSYLEIGISDGGNFRAIRAPHKIGVDPDPKTPATFHMTSSEYFKHQSECFDLIFIDGLHHREVVINDIETSLERLNPGGTIVVHDCNPETEAEQMVPRIQDIWTGDVWKAWAYWRQNPRLSMRVVDTDHGVGIIQAGWINPLPNLPTNPTYQYFLENRHAILNLITIDQFKKLYTNDTKI